LLKKLNFNNFCLWPWWAANLAHFFLVGEQPFLIDRCLLRVPIKLFVYWWKLKKTLPVQTRTQMIKPSFTKLAVFFELLGAESAHLRFWPILS